MLMWLGGGGQPLRAAKRELEPMMVDSERGELQVLDSDVKESR